MMHLLYPNNPLRPRQPDEQIAAELDAVRAAGFEVSLFSMEGFQAGEFRPVPPLPSATGVLYRGWMLSASEYGSMVSFLVHAGARPVISAEDYLARHHLPNW